MPPRVLLVLAALASLLGVLAPAAAAAPGPTGSGHPSGLSARTDVRAGVSGGHEQTSARTGPVRARLSARSDVRHGVSRRSRQTSGLSWAAATAQRQPTGLADLLAVLATAPLPAAPGLLVGRQPRPPDAVPPVPLRAAPGRAPPAPAGT